VTTVSPSATPVAAASLRRVHAAIAFNFFNAMTWQVALGTPMVLFAEKLGASAAAVGVAYSFVFLLTPIQVLSTSFLPRYGFKGMMLSGWGARSLFLLPPVVLAWVNPGPGTGVVWIFIASLFLFTFFRSIGACAWQPWMNALLSDRNRGRYFSLEQVASGIAGVGTLLVCWLSLRVMPLHQAFLLQYAFAFIGSWLAYYCLTRLPDAPKPSALPLATVLSESPRIVARPGAFRNYLVIGVVNGVAISAIPPFCAYYLKVVPQLTASQVVGFTLVQYVGVICGAFSIRNHVDRLGSRPFFQLALVLYVLIASFWIGVLRGWVGGLVPIGMSYFAIGVAASCWSSAANKYLPLVVGTENRTLAFSVQGAVTAVVSGFSPAIWGMFIKGHTDAPSVDVVAFQGFFVVAIACALFVGVRVTRLPAHAGAGGQALFGGVNLRAFRGFTSLASLVPPAEPAARSDKKAGDS
jgi:MFS family permease